jgi:hypothetical protein
MGGTITKSPSSVKAKGNDPNIGGGRRFLYPRFFLDIIRIKPYSYFIAKM